MSNPPTQTVQGENFLRDLCELMKRHEVRRITGYDDGDCWICFESDNFDKCKEVDRFELAVDKLPQPL